MSALEACPAEEAANLFFSHAVKHFGLHKNIVSDRDARFTGLGGTLQALRFGVEVLHNKSSSNRWPDQEDQCIVGRILEALCDGYTEKLGRFA